MKRSFLGFGRLATAGVMLAMTMGALVTSSLVTSALVAAPPAGSKEGKVPGGEGSGGVKGGGSAEHPIDVSLARENDARGLKLEAAPVIDDLSFLRRASVDLIGRIPSHDEITAYLAMPKAERRAKTIDRLIADDRFSERWSAFFFDMLRIRSNAEGGAALTAFIRKAVADGMPYDEMARRLIATNGKAGYTPEVGYILGDNADPMALAGITSQVFLGVRIACAQCHDHPFDVWKREDFYGFAAYFGKTKRVERRFKMQILSISALEDDRFTVLWPPEGVGEAADRKPMKARFPFEMAEANEVAELVAKVQKLRSAQQAEKDKAVAKVDNSVDDLLDAAADTAKRSTSGKGVDTVANEAKSEAAKIKGSVGTYEASDLRKELADHITSPRNRYFSRAFVNRVWHELVGKGFVEPIDDFSEKNQPSHPATLNLIADDFVASGYDLRSLVRLIVSSNVYQRGHVPEIAEATRVDLEANFLATPSRRMISEALFDSIVTAGRLFEVKHEAGKNLKTVWQESRVIKAPTRGGRDSSGPAVDTSKLAGKGGDDKAMMAGKMAKSAAAPAPGYDLESAIETKFEAILAGGKDDDEAMVDKMAVKSSEEIEAERMAAERQRLTADYIDRFVRAVIDDNPRFASSFNMPSPAPDGHFLRVFGQTDRDQLGEVRDHNPSMRQALMMLNGRLTHEASRVGELEPMYALVNGKKANLDAAVKLAYQEILTREPSADEIKEAKAVIAEGANPLEGMADLRWVLLNSNEFRFIP